MGVQRIWIGHLPLHVSVDTEHDRIDGSHPGHGAGHSPVQSTDAFLSNDFAEAIDGPIVQRAPVILRLQVDFDRIERVPDEYTGASWKIDVTLA